MHSPAAVFDPRLDPSEELVAMIALLLLTGGPAAAAPPRPNIAPHSRFRDPRGWR